MFIINSLVGPRDVTPLLWIGHENVMIERWSILMFFVITMKGQYLFDFLNLCIEYNF